jgi:NAD(P)-dependent dehydrogenase (short-subunit alcohol dehydrogenase family)
VVLGASSGFGEATALACARAGAHVLGVHLDRRSTQPNAERIQSEITGMGRTARFFNINAADPEARAQTLDAVAEEIGPGGVRVVLHSLAFGTLKRYVGDDVISQKQMEMTLDVMAHSLVYWAQDLVARGLLTAGGRVWAMTSAGGHRAWPSYGAVSAAKAALEAHIRQLAVELATKQISVNAIQAGVTDTPALRKIPGNDQLIAHAQELNPSGRLTTPDDVAAAIVALSGAGTGWMTGNVIRVDGGEDIVG